MMKKKAEAKEPTQNWLERWNRAHPRTSLEDLRAVSKLTGIPQNRLQAVIRKGLAMAYISGPWPAETARKWARTRLAGVLLRDKDSIALDILEMTAQDGQLYPWLRGAAPGK